MNADAACHKARTKLDRRRGRSVYTAGIHQNDQIQGAPVRIQSLLASLLAAAMLSGSIGASAGVAEQNVRDAANGMLTKSVPPEPTCRADVTRPPPYPMLRGEGGGGLLGAGIGLASLAVLAASASMLSPPRHGDIFRPACESNRIAKSSSDTYPFATPSSAPMSTE